MTSRIGVFVCDCKGLISDHVDTLRLTEKAASLQDVAFVDRRAMLCGEQNLGAALRRLEDEDCDRMLFAGCSPRSSLKFPEERISSVMQGLGLRPELFEVANIREQCAWQHPENNWGEQPGGFDLTGATRLVFQVRGAKGRERVKFGVGSKGRDVQYFDTGWSEKEVVLTKQWRQIGFDLRGMDLRRIRTGLMWVVEGQGEPVTFYLDEIRFE